MNNKILTVKEVSLAFAELQREAVADPSDGEGLHLEEDDLYETVLTAIAEGRCEDPQKCAAIVVQAKDLDFPRWYS